MGLFGNTLREMNIMLDEEDFKCLVRGGVLRVNEHLKLALEDIGFDRMEAAIESAKDGIRIGLSRNRETNDGKGYK